ncbi:hypothetical protein NSMM_510040 [Nitrosomonas mobilis]|uniref:Uncharacterized protein n=1 Tax=Nitrosomonas mobilis TaxID=51642 RepID=A0A1G5SGT4_9PROT|nr:hypothetical protein NSMM_510040 [Nitrosomonas mobilis]
MRFEPRFTDLNDQLQALSYADNPELYEKFLIKPINQIDIETIAGMFDEREIKVR